MSIKPHIYEKLTTRQRIIAALEAKDRGDDTEIERLIETAPDKGEANEFSIHKKVVSKHCINCDPSLSNPMTIEEEI